MVGCFANLYWILKMSPSCSGKCYLKIKVYKLFRRCQLINKIVENELKTKIWFVAIISVAIHHPAKIFIVTGLDTVYHLNIN